MSWQYSGFSVAASRLSLVGYIFPVRAFGIAYFSVD
jgi:hypothetical protein